MLAKKRNCYGSRRSPRGLDENRSRQDHPQEPRILQGSEDKSVLRQQILFWVDASCPINLASILFAVEGRLLETTKDTPMDSRETLRSIWIHEEPTLRRLFARWDSIPRRGYTPS